MIVAMFFSQLMSPWRMSCDSKGFPQSMLEISEVLLDLQLGYGKEKEERVIYALQIYLQIRKLFKRL